MRFNSPIPKMRGLSYLKRPNRLGLYSLDFRRMRGYFTKTNKLLNAHSRVDVEMMSLVGEPQTKINCYKIKGQSFKMEVHRNLFSQRMENNWNFLSQWALDIDYCKFFQVVIDMCFNNQGIWGFWKLPQMERGGLMQISPRV